MVWRLNKTEMGKKRQIERGRATRTDNWLSVQNLQETTTTLNSSPNVKHASNGDPASNSSATWQDSLLYHTHVPSVICAMWRPVKTTYKQFNWNCTGCIIWSFMHKTQTKSATMIWTNQKTFVLKGCFWTNEQMCTKAVIGAGLVEVVTRYNLLLHVDYSNMGHEVGKGSNNKDKATLKKQKKTITALMKTNQCLQTYQNIVTIITVQFALLKIFSSSLVKRMFQRQKSSGHLYSTITPLHRLRNHLKRYILI